MMTMVEGIYKNGHIELTDKPSDLEEGTTVVLYLQKKSPPLPEKEPQYMKFGMYPELLVLTDDDFKSAEFHGDPDDGLDWSGC